MAAKKKRPKSLSPITRRAMKAAKEMRSRMERGKAFSDEARSVVKPIEDALGGLPVLGLLAALSGDREVAEYELANYAMKLGKKIVADNRPPHIRRVFGYCSAPRCQALATWKVRAGAFCDLHARELGPIIKGNSAIKVRR